MTSYLWLIPALPLLGFVFNGLLGGVLGKRVVSVAGPGLVGASFVLSLLAFLEMLESPDAAISQTVYTWIASGGLSVDVAFLVDRLSGIYILVVTGVGFLIHLYSVGYMDEEEAQGFARFFAYLNLFIFFMLLLVLGSSMLLLFVGWEGVGLCSYLLIGYYFWRDSAASAAKKAFVVNRIGDFGFLVASFILFTVFGTLEMGVINAQAEGALAQGGFIATAVALLLFLAATGKSAQLPLYVWLPDAMEGPTPVSALIHAATMVTAGLYMMARMSHVFVLAPDAMAIIAGVGAATAFFAGTIGLAQSDIKRVLAYSTVSQLGYMVMAIGVGAFMASIFHVLTHAFFKALLFLGSGSVIVALHHEQDLGRMGGLLRRMPITGWTFIIGALAISGFPFIMAGFFSKDEILWASYSSPWGHPVLWAVGAVTAVVTAFYMFRLVGLTFFGKSRVDPHVDHHVHESHWTMTLPLVVLAGLSIVGGWIGIPHVLGQFMHLPNVLEEYFHGFFATVPTHGEHHSLGVELGLMATSTVAALVAMLVAWRLYSGDLQLAERLKGSLRPLHALLENKYYVDELYDLAVVQPLFWFSRVVLWRLADVAVIDGFVNGVGQTARSLGGALRLAQNGIVQNYAIGITIGALIIFWYLVF